VEKAIKNTKIIGNLFKKSKTEDIFDEYPPFFSIRLASKYEK